MALHSLGGESQALRLPPGGRADKIDFDLTLTPELEQMEDDAFAATYPQQRVYLNFPFWKILA